MVLRDINATLPFRLSPVGVGDLNFLAQVRNESRDNLGDARIVGVGQQSEWLEGLRRDPSREYFIFEDSAGGPYGYVRLTSIDWINRSACVGGDVPAQLRGRGLGTEMLNMAIAYCFDTLNLRRLWLLVLSKNRAIHLYKRLGFKKEGVMRQAIWRDGKYMDYILMGLLRKDKP